MTETEQIESVFGGKEAIANTNGANDKDNRIAELERELQKERVEAGRLKKTNDELSALREEVARLKEQKGVDAAIASVPEDVRQDIAPEVLRASGTMVNSVAGSMVNGMSERINRDIEKQNEEIRMLREENARRDRTSFTQRINMQYPGFISSVSDGGDKHDAWVKYQRFNANTIKTALASNDFDTIAYHIERFCNEIGVPVPSGMGGSATPDPRALAGGNSSASAPVGKVYTQDEFMALYDALEVARDRGDSAEMARLNAEIKSAPAEGRVK